MKQVDLAKECRAAAQESGALSIEMIRRGWPGAAGYQAQVAAHFAQTALDIETGRLTVEERKEKP